MHSLNTGPLERLNTASVVLIQKTEVAQTAKHFRPISLIHSFAKLIAMILAIRLAKHINNLVSHSQSAFIKRHYCIQDNFLYVRNLAWAFQPGHQLCSSNFIYQKPLTESHGDTFWKSLLILAFAIAGGIGLHYFCHRHRPPSYSMGYQDPSYNTNVNVDFIRAIHSLHTSSDYLSTPYIDCSRWPLKRAPYLH